MKITYDASVDVLRILFSDAPIAESDEDKQGVILDYSADGALIGVEILNAAARNLTPTNVTYSAIGTRPA